MPRTRKAAHSPDVATLADIEHRAVAMLCQIDENEGRPALQLAAERLLNGSVLTILQVSGMKRLNEVLEHLDQSLRFDDIDAPPTLVAERLDA